METTVGDDCFRERVRRPIRNKKYNRLDFEKKNWNIINMMPINIACYN